MTFGQNPSDSNRPLLGQLLVDAGLLGAADLESVLERQRRTGVPLGRILVDEGYVPAHSVATALAEQHASPSNEEETPKPVAVPDPEPAAFRNDMAAELEASAARVHAAELARDEALTALTSAYERAALLEADLEELSSRPQKTPGRKYSEERHTLFVPGSSGYRAVERSGRAPEPGAEVAMSDEARFRVVRIGPSPLPGETHPHVYLDRIGPSWAGLA
jgi:hypothetical protein